MTHSIQLNNNLFITKNPIDPRQLIKAYPNSVSDISNNGLIAQDHRFQVFEFAKLFDWMTTKMGLK